jgi:hypothetical protein
MLTSGFARYLVVSLVAAAAVLAGLGGGWFEGS